MASAVALVGLQKRQNAVVISTFALTRTSHAELLHLTEILLPQPKLNKIKFNARILFLILY